MKKDKLKELENNCYFMIWKTANMTMWGIDRAVNGYPWNYDGATTDKCAGIWLVFDKLLR